MTDVAHTSHLELADATPALAPLVASAPPAPVLEVPAVVTPISPVFQGLVTHYGVSYNGNPMGCSGELYSSENETIIAVGPADYGEWPCGTNLRVCGPTGCVVGFRQDSCPGCGENHLDLSEAGINTVCGDQAHVCRVGIEEVIFEISPSLDPENVEPLGEQLEAIHLVSQP